jgi:AhpD family alkylhydroperoxidase
VARHLGHDSENEQPGQWLPGSMKGIQSIIKAAHGAGVPRSTMELAHLRASQVNGCSPCVYSGAISAKKAGESDERLFAVAAWRETDLFTQAERAALALAESMTRLADRPDPVADDVWDQAARHFDEKQLAGLVLWIATTNLFNRLNAATKQPAGAAW